MGGLPEDTVDLGKTCEGDKWIDRPGTESNLYIKLRMSDFAFARHRGVKFPGGKQKIGGVFTERLRKNIQRDFHSVSSPDYAMQINGLSI